MKLNALLLNSNAIAGFLVSDAADPPLYDSGDSDMLTTYDEAMQRGVFPHEGGYTNDAADPGGPTNWGITIYDARMYWKKSATAADVRAMPKDVAEEIYRKHYATVLRYNDLPAGLDYSVLDYGINSGVGRAGKVLRRLLGLPDNTSAITDEVIAAVNKREVEALINALNDERLRFLKSLKTWPVFGNGWGRRVREVRELSLTFAKQAPTTELSRRTDAQGKGLVAPRPEPVAATLTKVALPVGAAAGVGSHLSGHQIAITALAFGGAVIVTGGVAYLAHKRHQAQQEAPTPGTLPVPVAA